LIIARRRSFDCTLIGLGSEAFAAAGRNKKLNGKQQAAARLARANRTSLISKTPFIIVFIQ
jgi:hypothetical protein